MKYSIGAMQKPPILQKMNHLRPHRWRNQHFRVADVEANSIGFTAFEFGLAQTHRAVTRLWQAFDHATKTQIARTGDYADIHMRGQVRTRNPWPIQDRLSQGSAKHWPTAYRARGVRAIDRTAAQHHAPQWRQTVLPKRVTMPTQHVQNHHAAHAVPDQMYALGTRRFALNRAKQAFGVLIHAIKHRRI